MSSSISSAQKTSAMRKSRTVTLTAANLTPGGEVRCPNPKSGMQTWNGHPRVYLALVNGQAHCPYCGTVYRLEAAQAKTERTA